jgi:hypothetical protein
MTSQNRKEIEAQCAAASANYDHAAGAAWAADDALALRRDAHDVHAHALYDDDRIAGVDLLRGCPRCYADAGYPDLGSVPE